MHERVVFFDGVCALCDRSMRWLLEIDREGRLSYAPLQGETAKELLGRHPEADSSLATVIYVRDFALPTETVFQRSDAAAAILDDLGGIYRFLALVRLVPRRMRDGLYDFVASRRYRWFGRFEACRLPAAGEAGRFLP